MNEIEPKPTKPDNNQPRLLLTPQELAARLGFCTRTIRNLQRLGMPHIKLSRTRSVRFEPDEAMDWLRREYRVVRRGK